MKGHEEGNTFLELEITFDHPQSSMDPLNVEYRWRKWRFSKKVYYYSILSFMYPK